MAIVITGSVGEGGKNNTLDVILIQNLLNKWLITKISVTGLCTGIASDPTVMAIKTFQGSSTKSPDGRVDPGGGTLKKLNKEPFILLPQMSGYGYYSYGSGNWYERQWGTKATIDALLDISKQFKANNPSTPIAIGDISFQFGGNMPPHGTHREGKHIDLRPCRIDNAMFPVTYTDTVNYHQANTKLLIEVFLAHKNVKNILFNDPKINALANVSPWAGHDNHFHVTMLD